MGHVESPLTEHDFVVFWINGWVLGDFFYRAKNSKEEVGSAMVQATTAHEHMLVLSNWNKKTKKGGLWEYITKYIIFVHESIFI